MPVSVKINFSSARVCSLSSRKDKGSTYDFSARFLPGTFGEQTHSST